MTAARIGDTVHAMPTAPYPLIRVEHDPHGDWKVDLPDGAARVRCTTLDEARRLAYRHAAGRELCELVIRDAYHRVAHRELVGAAD
jgi:hypothetical protein